MKRGVRGKSDNNGFCYQVDDGICFIATLAMMALVIAPALMALISMFTRSIDFTMNIYMPLVKQVVFPFACSLIFLIYIFIIFIKSKSIF